MAGNNNRYIVNYGTSLVNYKLSIENNVVGLTKHKGKTLNTGDLVYLLVKMDKKWFLGATGLLGEKTKFEKWENHENYPFEFNVDWDVCTLTPITDKLRSLYNGTDENTGKNHNFGTVINHLHNLNKGNEKDEDLMSYLDEIISKNRINGNDIKGLFENFNFKPAIPIDDIMTDSDGGAEEDDMYYNNSVIKAEVKNRKELYDNAHRQELKVKSGQSNKYIKNPEVGKAALEEADYKCENDNSPKKDTHNTFHLPTGKQFMEAHHLIPMSFAGDMYKRFKRNIDCPQNIVSLCPTCHRKIHYAEKKEKLKLIEKLFNLKKGELDKINIKISLDELKTFYKL